MISFSEPDSIVSDDGIEDGILEARREQCPGAVLEIASVENNEIASQHLQTNKDLLEVNMEIDLLPLQGSESTTNKSQLLGFDDIFFYNADDVGAPPINESLNYTDNNNLSQMEDNANNKENHDNNFESDTYKKKSLIMCCRVAVMMVPLMIIMET